MKKLFMAILAICLACGVANAELTKKQQKRVDKEVKAKMKEYKKEGWKLFGSSRTMESALEKHIEKLETLGDDAFEQVGFAGNFKSKSVGHQQAINNACIEYAGKAGSAIRGNVTADLKANGSDVDDEFEHFYAAYQRLVEREIQNEMDESFSVIRDQGNGTYEMQVFFIVNENAAAKARERAAKAAMKDSQIAQQHASTISDYVRKAFER